MILEDKEKTSKMKREPTVWENIFANNTWDSGLVSKVQKELTAWENIFANDTLGKGLITKIYEELIQFNTRKTIQLKCGQRI